MVSNTRLSPRTSLSRLGFIQIFGDDGGRILNISDSGLSFESFAPVGEARTLQFWFSLNLRDRVEATGEIVWLDDGTRVGGLRFVNPTDRVIQHIRRYSEDIRRNGATRNGQFSAEALASQKAAGIPKQSSATRWQIPGPANFDSTELISWQKHLEVCRKKFVYGLVLGLCLASTATVAAYRFLATRPPAAVVANSSRPSSPSQSGSSGTFPSSLSAEQTIPSLSKRPSTVASRIHPGDAPGESRTGRQLLSSGLLLKETGPPAAVHASASPQIQNSPKKIASSQQLWSAVQAGDTDAAVLLADRYLHGDGVPANCLQARVLLLVASEKRNAVAIKKLDELDKTGCPADPKQ